MCYKLNSSEFSSDLICDTDGSCFIQCCTAIECPICGVVSCSSKFGWCELISVSDCFINPGSSVQRSLNPVVSHTSSIFRTTVVRSSTIVGNTLTVVGKCSSIFISKWSKIFTSRIVSKFPSFIAAIIGCSGKCIFSTVFRTTISTVIS